MLDDKIRALLGAQPLPDDAEQQLDSLLADLPPEERDLMEPLAHEALAVARGAEGFDGTFEELKLSQ